jgi:hypothetical protein
MQNRDIIPISAYMISVDEDSAPSNYDTRRIRAQIKQGTDDLAFVDGQLGLRGARKPCLQKWQMAWEVV